MSLLILAGNALISYNDLLDQEKNLPQIIRSREVLDRVADIGAAIRDAESARRGYLIDGNQDDLKEFELAAHRVATLTDSLKHLTEADENQHRRSLHLDQDAIALIAKLRQSIGPVQLQGVQASRATFRDDPARKFFAEFRDQIASIEVDESRTQVARVKARRDGTSRAVVTFSVVSTLALVTIGSTYALLRRHLRDRSLVERTLQESEARIRLLFDSVGEGIYGIDTHGSCTFCNPSALKILGFDSIDQVLGRDMHQLVHHTRADGSPFPSEMCPIYQTFHSGEGVLGVEDFFFRPDGRAVPVEYRAHAIRRDGEILGAVVTFVDIAPKRLGEVKMRLRDRALRAIAQGVFITDPTTPANPIVYANAAFERLTGYQQEDWTGRSFDLLKGEQSVSAMMELQAAVRDRREATVELLTRRKDGSTFWQSLTLAPVGDRHSEVSHFVGVITDISERRESEQKLRQSEARLRLMIESVRDYAIFSIDLEGRISSWNSGAERLFGMPESQILGEPVDRLFTLEDRMAQIPTSELAMAATSGQFEVERWHVRGDGSRFFTSEVVTAVRDDLGTLLSFTKVARDITKSKQVENELRTAKEAAESSIRAKNTFLANMGHELRTPLNAVIGFSEMLEDEAIERGMNDFLSDLKRIREAGHLLLKLINNILALAKIEAGGMDLSDESFDIANLVRGVARSVEPMAEKHGNIVQVEYPSDLGTLHADLAKVRQGLSHLLSNAVKFTESGTIIFRVTRESDANDREWVVFTIADDGIGMTHDEMSRLFQPFVQADGSPARRYGGTGLGLTITHRFCQMMGGTIDVESEPDRGTTVVMRLPVRHANVVDMSHI